MILNWLSQSAVAAALLAAAVYLARNVIRTRLTRSVQYEFDAKLEAQKADLRTSEERFKAELRRRDDEIAAARNTVLNAITNSRAAIDERRLRAVDQLWQGVKILSAGTWSVSVVSTFDMDYVCERIEHEPKLMQAFKMLAPEHDKLIAAFKTPDADSARPYLSDITWALYSAYRSIMALCVSYLSLLKLGIPAKKFLDLPKIAEIVKTALPEYSAYVDQYGVRSYAYLLEELENRILSGLRADIEGHASDDATIQRASRILRAANELRAQGYDVEAERALSGAELTRASRPKPPS